MSFVGCFASWLLLVVLSELLLIDGLLITNWLLSLVLFFGFSWVVVAVI